MRRASDAYEHGGQHRKDVRLDERDEKLENVDEQRETDHHRDEHPGHERQSDQRKKNDVTSGHVCEQSHTQSEWLREQTKELDWHHDRPEPNRYAACKVIEPRTDAVLKDC